MCQVPRHAYYMPSSEARPLCARFRGMPIICQVLRRAHYMRSSEVCQSRATFRGMFIIVIPTSEVSPSASFLDVSIVIMPTFEACVFSILCQLSKHARPVPSLDVYSSLRQGLRRVRHIYISSVLYAQPNSTNVRRLVRLGSVILSQLA